MKSLLTGLALAAAIAVPASAQTPQIVRGTVTAATATQMTVKPKTGAPVVVSLTPDWSVSVTKPIAISDIKAGSFIGTAEMPKAEGVGRSLEVHVFPPGVKVGEGHYAWDLRKGSKMTNGTVGTVKVVGKGRELDVSYPNGQRKIVVPASTPIVQITPGDRAQVKTGARIFAVVAPKPGGGVITNTVAVGLNGAAPPM